MPKTLRVKLDLRDSADFRLVVPTRRKHVVAGTNATYDVSVERLGGHTTDVLLSHDDTPSGAIASFDDDELSIGESAVLTVGTTSITPGTHYFFNVGEEAPGDEIWAESPALADVQAAVNAVGPGDTVRVPAGSATWASQLVITKGVLLIGAGIGSTVITSTQSGVVLYNPDSYSISNDIPFRFSGFTIDHQGVASPSGLVNINNSNTASAITNVRIDHVRFFDTTTDSIIVQGQVYGVADNCVFDNARYPLRLMGNNRESWDEFPLNSPPFGGADNFYMEDCSFVKTGGNSTAYINWFSTGHGGRYCIRHCTSSCQTELDVFDVHGNQPGGLCAAMKAEFYDNVFTGAGRALKFASLRGGQTLIYNNSIAGVSASGSWISAWEEYDDAISPIDSGTQYPHDTYSWGNTGGGVSIEPIYIQSTYDYGGEIGLVPRANVHVWSEVTPFTGATGVGVGLLAARPSSGLTAGVGYWATDTGLLYRATGATTWETFYTPYTYPHPLRGE